MNDPASLARRHWARGEHDRAREHAEQCLERGAATGDVNLRLAGLLALCRVDHAVGRYADGERRAREVLELRVRHAEVCAIRAACLSELGDHAGALALVRDAREAAGAGRDRASQLSVASAEGCALVMAGRPDQAVAVLEPAVRACRDHALVEPLIDALKHLARAYLGAGRASDAIAPAQESIALQENAGVRVNRGLQHAVLARAFAALGDLDRATAEAAHAVEIASLREEQGVEAWARLAAGVVAARRGDAGEAARWLDEADEIAEPLGMATLVEECRRLARSLR